MAFQSLFIITVFHVSEAFLAALSLRHSDTFLPLWDGANTILPSRSCACDNWGRFRVSLVSCHSPEGWKGELAMADMQVTERDNTACGICHICSKLCRVTLTNYDA